MGELIRLPLAAPREGAGTSTGRGPVTRRTFRPADRGLAGLFRPYERGAYRSPVTRAAMRNARAASGPSADYPAALAAEQERVTAAGQAARRRAA
jgi:hypothetical protein